MKNIITTITIFLFGSLLIIIQPVQAQMGSMIDRGNSEGHGESIEVVLGDILARQQITTVQELYCDRISDNDLERLGDAVMEKQHPEEAHDIMDRMMGGKGTESLKQMHVNMGGSYLGCDGNYGSGMMGGGMMGMMVPRNLDEARQGSDSMMGFGNGAMGSYGILGGLTWIALIAFLLAGVYFFIKQANKK